MPSRLTQYRLCPRSRSIRLALAEYRLDVELLDEKPWEWRQGFLAKNPAGEMPVLEFDNGLTLCGAYSISEFLAEEIAPVASVTAAAPPALIPGGREDRAEVRRLIDWYHGKFDREVTRELLIEKVYNSMRPSGPIAPDPNILRAVRANLKYHLSYTGFLADSRRWLSGDDLSFADLAAAAHISTCDYLGEIPWREYPTVKNWYQRMKSRPSFSRFIGRSRPRDGATTCLFRSRFLNGCMSEASRSRSDLSQMLRAEAKKLGLDAVGIARLAEDTNLPGRLAHFLNESRHGDMDWMETHADRRGDPLRLWPDAKSAVVFGQSYAPPDNPLDALDHPSNATISVYAKGRDYHDVLKKRIKSLARVFAESSGAEVKVFVDTAPLMEKPLAAKAGLGWQGKHTILVSREHGNWLFLGAMLTTAELEPDESMSDHCGSCRRCLDICPTNAFPTPYQLDARRCIAYLTIEHKGHIAPEFRAPIGNRVFGCDDCAAVCPWNKFAGAATEIKYAARPETDNPPLAELLALDDAAFRLRFAGTPIKRTGRDRIVRNALIASGNSGDRALLRHIVPLLGDRSPLVRAMAIWASRRLADTRELHVLQRRHQDLECDPQVAAEWIMPMEDQAA